VHTFVPCAPRDRRTAIERIHNRDSNAVSTRAPLVSPDDQKVTFVELFFDLVFVFCVTQIAAMFHGHIDLPTAGKALLVFWLVWWAWTQFTWALNAANTHHPRVQITILVATAVAFFMAVGIPGALGDRALWFAVPYVAGRAIGLLLYYAVAWPDPNQRQAVRVFGLTSLGGIAVVIVGALAGGAAQYAWWGLAIALDMLAAKVGSRLEGWNLHPDHFVERHGLIVIIALGETLIVAAAGLADATMTATAIATAVAAVALTGSLWWSYFERVRHAFEHALRSRQGNARSRLASEVFSLMHFPMLCGVIALAAATEESLAHPDEPLATGVRLALGAGAVLFVCGTGLAIWRATGKRLVWRWVLIPLGAAVVVGTGAIPWVAMTTLFLTLLAMLVVEHRQAA
jgi:low temperature requirement protein LtrA